MTANTLKLLNSIVFIILVTSTLHSATDQDEGFSRRLIGTWITPPADSSIASTALTLNSDGSGVEVVTANSPMGKVAISAKISWTVSNGILTIKALSSSHPKLIPVGTESQDRIISISEDKYEYETSGAINKGSGQKEFLIRKRQSDERERV